MNDIPPDPHPAPYHALLGITLEQWREDFSRVACETGRQHTNRSGIVHGGLILSMIDQAAAYAGLWCSVPGNIRRAVTLDLDCRFTGQVASGRLTANSTHGSSPSLRRWCALPSPLGNTAMSPARIGWVP